MSARAASLAVLMISPQFRPLVGGYERAAERLSAALSAAGLRVLVLTERHDPGWPAREALDGYEVRRLWCGYRRLLHGPIALLSFAGFLLREGRGFDVWHAHQYGAHAALAVALGALLRRPVVIKTTSSGPLGLEKRLSDRPAGPLLRALHRRVSACVAISEETRAEAIRFGIPKERVHLIPNGVDGRRFQPSSPAERAAARRALGLDCRRLLLFVGRLSAEKNPLVLLKAWASIDARAREEALLALVGDGPQREKVRAAASVPGLAGSVHLAGAREDVELWYRAADGCVVSSEVDGLSNAMVEALAAGLPVVSTWVSGSSVLVEPPGAGLLAPVGDVAALARAIEALLRDGAARARLARNARALFESRFSLERVSQRTISLYMRLCAGA